MRSLLNETICSLVQIRHEIEAIEKNLMTIRGNGKILPQTDQKQLIGNHSSPNLVANDMVPAEWPLDGLREEIGECENISSRTTELINGNGRIETHTQARDRNNTSTANDKNTDPDSVRKLIDSIQMSDVDEMLNDDYMWNRRAEEHKKQVSQTTPEHPTEPAEHPVDKYPPINALSRISFQERERVLYNIYKEAKANVAEILGEQFDPKVHADLIKRESDNLLAIWMKHN